MSEYIDENGGYDLEAAYYDAPLETAALIIEEAVVAGRAQAAADVAAAAETQQSDVEMRLRAKEIADNLERNSTAFRDKATQEAFGDWISADPGRLGEDYLENPQRLADAFDLFQIQQQREEQARTWERIRNPEMKHGAVAASYSELVRKAQNG